MARKQAVDPLDEDEVKSDMTPMIDIIFLLLIFFILTTKFVVPEKAISQLLPTNKGQASASPPVVEPPQDINILVYPAGFTRGMGVEQMDTMWKSTEDTSQAMLRVSNQAALPMVGSALRAERQAALRQPMGEIEAYIHGHLEAAEVPGSRKEQRPVVIHCFSGLSWKYAILAYDAVRTFEGKKVTVDMSFSDRLREAREVSFSPPRVRNYHTWELGNELWEIINMK
jgi:biopolymer transport protein ExbD